MSISRQIAVRLRGAMLACAAALVAAPAWSQSPGPASPPPSAAPLPDTGSYAEFRKLLDARQYDQAAEEARKLVDEASKRPESEELQVALMNLGVAQYLDGDYVGAETSYKRVIELVEASSRPTSPRLARAYAGLATTYYSGKRYDLAVTNFDRAVALSRRSEGLFNEAQLPLLEKYANALTEVNRLQDALKVQRYALKVVEHKFGADSLRYAQQLDSIGSWYTRVRAYDAARASLLRAIDIIEAAKGENAVELIDPLTSLAECDRRQLLDPVMQQANSADQQRAAMFHDPTSQMGPSLSLASAAGEGQKALERAVSIATSTPGVSPVKVADVRTQLGDWYQSRQQPDKALPNYQQAWQAATGQTLDGKPLTEALFGRPVLLHYLPPDSWDRYYGRPPGETVVKNAQVEFTVTAQGRVVNPKVLEDAGDPKLGAQTSKAAQAARYRPRFDKGAPVDTSGVKLDQAFYVLADKAPKSEPAPNADAAPKTEPAPAAEAAKPGT